MRLKYIYLTIALLLVSFGMYGQTNNYFGTAGTVNTSVWSTNLAGPYTSAANTIGGWIMNFNNAGALTWATPTTYPSTVNFNAAMTWSTGGTFGTAGLNTVINVASGVNIDPSGSQTYSTSATAAFTKNGAGSFAIVGNTYGGGFTLNAGTVIVRGVNGLGGNATPGPLTINGGTIAANANRDLTGKYSGITFGGDFGLGSSTVGISVGTANLTFSNNVSLGSATRTITLGGTGNYTFGGIISGTSTAGLTLGSGSTAGTVFLTGANTYPGNTTIDGGTLALSGSGSIANSPIIRVGSGGTFNVSGLTTALTLGASQTLSGSATGSNTTGIITVAASKDLTLSAGGLSFTAYGGGATAPITVTGASAGALALNSAPVTITTTTALTAGTYTIVAKAASATGVSGTPGTLTVNGSGLASGTTGALSVVSGQLILTVTTSSFTVTFNGNGSTGGSMATQTASVATNLTTNAFTRTGYTFAGWATTAGGAVAYSDNASYAFAANVTLFAQWTPNNNTVTFDKNAADATGTTTAQTIATAASANLTANGYSRTGYTFAGWATTSGGAVAYTNTASYTMGTASVTLYAVWTALGNFTVTFNANSGTGSMAPQITNTATALTTNAFTRAGFIFAGWNTIAIGGGTGYPDGASYPFTADVTLYAQWTATYTLTYNGNSNTSGTAPTDSSSPYLVGATATVLANTGALARTGYTFAGWNAASNGGGADYAATGSATLTIPAANTILYAKWTANNNTITFDKNAVDATGTTASQTLASDATATLTSNGYSRTGYTFAGWATTAGGTASYTNNASYTIGTASVTLYAVWTANNNTITFDKNAADATGTMANQTIATAATAALTTNSYTRTGYTFAGWATTAGGTVAYSNTATYTMGTASVTLYAVWSVYVAPCFTETFTTGTKPTGWIDSATGITYSANYADISASTGNVTTIAMANPTTLTFDLSRTTNSTQKNLNIEVSTTSQTTGFSFVANYDHSSTTSGGTTPCTVDLSAYSSNATVYIKFNKTSGNTSPWRIDNINVFCCTNASLAFATASYSKNIGDANFIQTATTSSPGAVSYASNNTSAATVNATTGEITIGATPGTATITATQVANGSYCSATATYSVVVTSPSPTISTSGTLTALSTTTGTASTNTTFLVSAANLTNNLIITPPSGFEVSISASSGFTTSLDLGSSNRTNTTIYVRLAATTAVGSYSGNIRLESTGATTVNVATASSTVTAVVSGCNELFISEYAEGSSNNKYIEIYNPTASSIVLTGNYDISVYNNGSTTPTTIALSGTILAYSTFVLKNPSASSSITSNQTSGSISFNGNDAVALRKATVLIDVIGVIGTDPQTKWGTSPTSTLDNTLVRKSTISAGDSNGSDAFDPATEWDGYAVDTWTNSGSHTSDCDPTPRITSATTALTALSYIYGSGPATEQSFTISGSKLTANLIVTPPANYEISSTSGSGFVSSPSTLSFTPSSGTVTSKIIYVRLKAGLTVTTYNSQIITIASTNATDKTVTCSGSVTAKNLTITGLTTSDKVYDGANTATVTGTPVYSGLVLPDAFSVSGSVSWAFSSANVGATLTLTGSYSAPSSNYSITQPTLTANITAKPLTIAAASIAAKGYDGSVVSGTVTPGTLSGLISPETLVVTATGAYADATVGTGKSAIITYILANGTNGGLGANYSLVNGTGTGDISRANPVFTTATIAVFAGGTYVLPGANVATTSDGALSYTITAGGSATLSGNTITGVSTGTETLTVNQAASTNYNAGSTTVSVATVTTATDYFRSKTSGSWATVGNWESSSNGTTWITATLAPTAVATAITIQNAHTMSIATGSVTADDVTVATGGTLTISGGTFILNNGAATTDLQVNGTLNYNSGTFTQNASSGIAFGANATYNHAIASATLTLPITATWNASSNCNITGMTNSTLITAVNLGQAFGNFTYNNPNQSGTTSYVNIENNNFSVSGTMTVGPSMNNNLSFGNSGSYTNTINRLVVSGGYLGVSGNATVNLNVTNDVLVTGTDLYNYGTLEVSIGSGAVNLNIGTDLALSVSGIMQVLGGVASSPNQTVTIGRDLLISGASGAQLNLEFISASGVATVNVARDFICSTSNTTYQAVDFGTGTVSGNVIAVGRNFSKSGNGFFYTTSTSAATGFSFNGTGTQTFSYSGTTSDATSYIVQNGSTVQLNSNLTLGIGTSPASWFTVANGGTLNFGTNSIIAGNTTDPRFITTSGATLITSNTNGFGGTTASGSLQSFGSVGTASVAGRAVFVAGTNYTFNGATTTPFPATFGNPATVNSNASVTSNMTSTLTVTTAFTINNGGTFALNPTTNNLNLNGAALTINTGGTFDSGGENQVNNGGGSPTVVISGKFITRDAQGFVGTNTAIPSITPTLNAGCTIEYGFAGNQAVQGTTAPTYQNITFSGGGIKTLASANAVAGTITIAGATTFDAGSNPFGSSTSNVTMTGASLYKLGGTTASKPESGGTYTLDPLSTFEFTGTSDTNIRVSVPVINYANIIISGTARNPATTTGIKFQSNRSFTVKSGGVFRLNNTAGFTGSTTTAIDNTNPPTITLETGSRIEFAGNQVLPATQTITPFATYSDLGISGTGTKTLANITEVYVGRDLLLFPEATPVNTGFLQIDANRLLTVERNILNTSTKDLIVKDSGNLVQVTTVDNATTNANTGNIKMTRTSRSMVNNDYIYWGTPVKDNGSLISQIPTNFDSTYQWDLTGAIEGAWNALSAIVPGRGFITRVKTAVAATQSFNFTGVANNGNVNVTANAYDTNFNLDTSGNTILLANPYPSALDATKFFDANASILDGTLYFWTSSTANSGAAYSTNDYASWNKLGGTSTAPPTTNPILSLKPTGKIAAGQGFFADIHADGIISFTNAMRERTTSGNSQFFKTTKANKTIVEKHRIWLNLTNKKNAFRQMLVGYISDATNGFDRSLDGEAFTDNEINIYSVLDDKTLVIQGRALPFEDADMVPLGIVITNAGEYTIAIDEVDGIFKNGQDIYLEDKLLNVITNLKNPYTFNTAVGTFKDRFVLRYTDKTLGTTDFEKLENQVLVSNKNKQIKVNSKAESIDKVSVYDLVGRQLFKKDKVNSTELTITNLVSNKQVLLVKITLQNGNIVTKKIMP